MSYDIDIADREFNYTYNLAPFFRAYIPGGVASLDGLRGGDAAVVVRSAFERMAQDANRRGFADRYDAENGWGTTCGAMCLLALLLSACLEHSSSVVAVR